MSKSKTKDYLDLATTILNQSPTKIKRLSPPTSKAFVRFKGFCLTDLRASEPKVHIVPPKASNNTSGNNKLNNAGIIAIMV
jgi:hypothetical protein